MAGLLSCFVAAGFWLVVLYDTPMTSAFGIKILMIAPVINILGQLGDLFESMLKRSQTQKDSGSFLPGHGGILDRIDSLIYVAPLFMHMAGYYHELR